jgi:hypothetical protein
MEKIPKRYAIRTEKQLAVLACAARQEIVDVLAEMGTVSVERRRHRIVAMPSSLIDLQKMAAVPLNLRIAVVLTAAICEEFMYRGFGIEELAL